MKIAVLNLIESSIDNRNMWRDISHQNLSEYFIEKYQDKVDWFYISGSEYDNRRTG